MNCKELMENNDSFCYLKNYYNDERFIKACVGSHELKHSNILQWIFNPNSNSNLKYFAIRSLLKYYDIDLTNEYIKGVEILREENHIDLFIRVQLENSFISIVIENKLNALLSNGQLERYKEIIENTYPKDKHLYLYLHPTTNDESNEAIKVGYKSLTYQELYEEVLFPLLSLSIDNDTRIYLKDYIYTLSMPLLDDGSSAIITKEEVQCLKELIEKNAVIQKIIKSVKDKETDEYSQYYRENKSLFITIFKKYLSIQKSNRDPNYSTDDIEKALKAKAYILNGNSEESINKLLIKLIDGLLKKYTLNEINDLIHIFKNPLIVEDNEVMNTKNPGYYSNKNIITKDNKKFYLLSSWYSSDYEILKKEFNKLKVINNIYKDITIE